MGASWTTACLRIAIGARNAPYLHAPSTAKPANSYPSLLNEDMFCRVDGPARAGEKGTLCAPAGRSVREQVGGCPRNCQRRVIGPFASSWGSH